MVELLVQNPHTRQCIPIKFLLDSGAQFSIVNKQKLDSINCHGSSCSKVIKSLGLSNKYCGSEVNTKILTPDFSYVNLNVFAMPNFSLDMHVSGINDTSTNLNKSEIPLKSILATI